MRQFLITSLILVSITACKNPQVTKMGTPVVEGGIEFQVNNYDVRIVEVSEENKTFAYARPVLAISVEMKNVGKKSFTYTPTHRTQQMSEGSTPLLYEDPGPEADLPPESKVPIMGVYLERGALKDQIPNPKTVEPGETILDTFLFAVPDVKKNLILSIPPTMHAGKLPVLVRVPFEPKEPKGPKIYKMGDTAKFIDVDFSVTHAHFEKVKLRHSTKRKGQSRGKLLKIDYLISNNSAAPILFDPSHRDLSGKGANLFGSDRAYKRVKFATEVKVIGQKMDVLKIQPGETVEDFVLFDVPEEQFDGATFEYPANLFQKDGVARFNIKLTSGKVEKEPIIEEKPAEANNADMGTADSGVAKVDETSENKKAEEKPAQENK